MTADGQKTLFAKPKPLRPLTGRQMRLYEWICEQPEGVTALELGQHLHADQLKHAGDICEWCGRDGARVIREKAIRTRLVKHGDTYEPVNHDDWTGRAEVGVPSPPSAQMRELAGETWEDAFGGGT